MAFKTTSFQWVDRDTAGYDLLQLAYHAPPYVCGKALQLLGSIRSTAIIDDLLTIVLDETCNNWHRIYALQAISATRLDRSYPQFKPLLIKQLQEVEYRWRTSNNLDREDIFWDAFLLEDMVGLVDNCPSNGEWFYDVLDNFRNPEIIIFYLSGQLFSKYMSNEIRDTLTQRLFALVQKHSQFLTLYIVEALFNNTEMRDWLNTRLETIITLLEKDDFKYLIFLSDWEELLDALRKRKLNPDQQIENHQREIAKNRLHLQPADLDSIPVYQKLKQLYDEAVDGNKTARRKLVNIAARYKGEIPIRAVATYFLGKLRRQYDRLRPFEGSLYINDDWGDEVSPHSPIRYEIGEFLISVPSARAWQTLIDSYFLQNPNVFAAFLEDWITYVTDVLSGVHTVYSGIIMGEISCRPWFKALADFDEDILDRYLEDK